MIAPIVTIKEVQKNIEAGRVVRWGDPRHEDEGKRYEIAKIHHSFPLAFTALYEKLNTEKVDTIVWRYVWPITAYDGCILLRFIELRNDEQIFWNDGQTDLPIPLPEIDENPR